MSRVQLKTSQIAIEAAYASTGAAQCGLVAHGLGSEGRRDYIFTQDGGGGG